MPTVLSTGVPENGRSAYAISLSTKVARDRLPPENLRRNYAQLPNNPPARSVPNQAKNNVTSRARLDEKYYDRRAVQKLAKYKLTSRVFLEYFSRKRCPARVQLPGAHANRATNSPETQKRPTVRQKKRLALTTRFKNPRQYQNGHNHCQQRNRPRPL